MWVGKGQWWAAATNKMSLCVPKDAMNFLADGRFNKSEDLLCFIKSVNDVRLMSLIHNTGGVL